MKTPIAPTLPALASVGSAIERAALAALCATTACVSRAPITPPGGAAFEKALPSPDFASAGLTIVPVRDAFPIDAAWSLTIALEGPHGTRRSYVLPTAPTGSGATPNAHRPFLLPLNPGRWTITSFHLKVEPGPASTSSAGSHAKGALEVPLPVSLEGGPVRFDVRQGAFVHLGDVEIRFEAASGSAMPSAPGAIGSSRIVTRYVPTRLASGAAWSPYLGGLSRLAIEGFEPGARGAPLSQAKAHVAFDSVSGESRGPLPDAAPGAVVLLSDAPSVVVFETAPWRVDRVVSRPLEGTAHHLVSLPSHGKGAVRVLGACSVPSGSPAKGAVPAPVEAAPVEAAPVEATPVEAALCRGDSQGRGAIGNLEPLDAATFRYVGYLEAGPSRERAMAIGARLPEDARARLSASLPVRSFILGELVRDTAPGAWSLVDAQGNTVVGFPPEDHATGKALETAVGACTASLWALDPLAPVVFDLAIESRADLSLGLEMARDQTRGFAGPGLEKVKGCLDEALARTPGFVSPALSRGVHARFR